MLLLKNLFSKAFNLLFVKTNFFYRKAVYVMSSYGSFGLNLNKTFHWPIFGLFYVQEG